MLGDLPLISALKSRMQYHQSRQKMLAENVANADSPGYKPKDLRPFDMMLAKKASDGAAGGPVRTQPGHLSGVAGGSLGSKRSSVFEATQSGNAVNLEDEMMRMAQNNSDFQLTASLYGKSLSYLRMALGKRV